MAVTTNRTLPLSMYIFAFYVFMCLCLGTSVASVENGHIPGIDFNQSIHEELERPENKRTHSKSESKSDVKDYHQMRTGVDVTILEDGVKKLHIFCYNGEPKGLTTLFKTVQLNLDIKGEHFIHFEGPNATIIRKEQKEVSWLSFSPWRSRTFRLDLYNPSCIGIETRDGFNIGLRIRWVDFWRVVLLVGAVLLFFAASHLAKNVFFHYTTGITIGIFGSLLIVVIIVGRMMPKKTSAIAVTIGGWGLAIYAIQYLWQNILDLVKQYQAVAVGYVVVGGLISFALIYRYGPLTDQRSISLVQWFMQLISLVTIFFSSQFREATLGVVIIMLSYHNIPSKWKAKVRTYWRRRFPPKIKRLTEEEYIQQGNIETRKALEDLREYCRSPNCNAWKTVSRLHTPTRFVEFVGNPSKRQSVTPKNTQRKRFAEFVEGGSHLDDDAILAYETNHLTPNRDEDELYITTDDEEDD